MRSISSRGPPKATPLGDEREALQMGARQRGHIAETRLLRREKWRFLALPWAKYASALFPYN